MKKELSLENDDLQLVHDKVIYGWTQRNRGDKINL